MKEAKRERARGPHDRFGPLLAARLAGPTEKKMEASLSLSPKKGGGDEGKKAPSGRMGKPHL